MRKRSGKASPRAVLLGALLFIVLGVGLYALAPWVLPVRILEGPMIQQADQTGVTLIWYTTRPVAAEQYVVLIGHGAGQLSPAVETDGTRNRARVDGLAPGAAYPYRIELGSRTLAAAMLHTNKSAGEPFSFLAFGDSGKGTRAQYLLAARMRGLPVDFILHTGDLVYGTSERHLYKDRFFAPYRHLLAEINFWPTLGNHELRHDDLTNFDDNHPYFNVFELPENGPAGLPPERNYWFDYASARIVVLDSNLEVDEATLRAQVVPWLRDVLGDCGADWKFVSLHHPPYTSGSYRSDVRLQRTVVPEFEALGVDVVFCGHDHMYQRTLALGGGEAAADGDGVVYIVTGAGGARLYDALPPEQRPAYLVALENEVHSFTYVQVDGPKLLLRQIDPDGCVIDECVLTKDMTAAEPPTEDEDRDDVGPTP